MLDVGCGRGVLLSALAERGFESHGFEVSPAAAAGVDPRAIMGFGKNLEEAAYPRSYFDQVIIWHVLEHLPDPRRTLDEIPPCLKPGGRLVVAVPNYSSLQARCFGAGWFHLDPPRHLYHFPVEGLRRLLESTGFQVDREHHFSLRQNPFGWVQSAAQLRPPTASKRSVFAAQATRRRGAGLRQIGAVCAAFSLLAGNARGLCPERGRCPAGEGRLGLRYRAITG